MERGIANSATSLSEIFSAAGNDLAVTASYGSGNTVMHTITLAAGRAYSASDFTVQNNHILFNAHPTMS